MGMIGQIAYTQIGGFSFILLGGIFAGILLIAAVAIGASLSSNKSKFTLKQHKIVALAAGIVAIAHGLFGILANLGF
jgi:hypothetical protein